MPGRIVRRAILLVMFGGTLKQLVADGGLSSTVRVTRRRLRRALVTKGRLIAARLPTPVARQARRLAVATHIVQPHELPLVSIVVPIYAVEDYLWSASTTHGPDLRQPADRAGRRRLAGCHRHHDRLPATRPADRDRSPTQPRGGSRPEPRDRRGTRHLSDVRRPGRHPGIRGRRCPCGFAGAYPLELLRRPTDASARPDTGRRPGGSAGRMLLGESASRSPTFPISRLRGGRQQALSRRFWQQRQFSFPDGVHYEDQHVSSSTYAVGRFDVLTKQVYNWRVRENQSSITQQIGSPDSLKERLVAPVRHSMPCPRHS